MNYKTAMQVWCQRRKEMAEKKSKNVPIRDIATEYGISTQRVYQILDEQEGKSGRSGLKQPPKALKRHSGSR